MRNIIRLATEEDAQQILSIYRPLVIDTAITFEVEPPTLGAIQHRITTTLDSLPWLVCEFGEGIQGYTYASAHRSRAAYGWSVEASVYVRSDARRKGVGSGLYHSLFKLLSLQGFFNVYAGITLPNPSSVGLHDSLGFVFVGLYRSVGFKLGNWHDVGWWQLSLSAPVENPTAPLPLADLKAREDIDATLAVGLPFLQF